MRPRTRAILFVFGIVCALVVAFLMNDESQDDAPADVDLVTEPAPERTRKKRGAEQPEPAEPAADKPSEQAPVESSPVKELWFGGPGEIDVPRASVAGRVVDTDGAAVSGADVAGRSTWYGWRVERALGKATPAFAATVAADEKGHFELPYYRGGDLTLTVVPPQGSGLTSWSRTFERPPADLTIRLAAQGDTTITGTVTARDGTPIVGASVEATLAATQDVGPILPTCTTDDAGRYSLVLPSTAPHAVRVVAEGYEHTLIDVEPDPGATTVDFVLDRGVTVRLLVMDVATDLPIEGAEASAAPYGGTGHNRTDRYGRCDIESLEFTERYIRRMVVTADGYAPSSVDWGLIPDGGDREIVVPMRRTADATWRCVDGEGKPLANVLVVVSSSQRYTPARPHGTGRVSGRSNSAYRTDAAGRVTIEGIAPGERECEARFFIRGVLALETTIAGLRAGEARDAGDIVLGSGATLRGKIETQAGKPAVGAWIVLASRKDGRPDHDTLANSGFLPGSGKFAYVDQDGAFEIAGLTPGVWDGLAWGVELPPKLIEGIDVPTEDLTIRLPRPVSLRCRLIGDDGAPVANAEITVLLDQPVDFNMAFSRRTDADGRCTFPGFAADGPDVWVRVEIGKIHEVGRYVVPSEHEIVLELVQLGEFDPDFHDERRGR